MVEARQPLVKRLTLEGCLSFGYGQAALIDMPFAPLNVLIGPNGSGKSNFLEALALLRAAPKDLMRPIRSGGGVGQWIWNRPEGNGSGFSDGDGAGIPAARIDVLVGEGYFPGRDGPDRPVRYRLTFGADGDSFVVLDERLENAEVVPGEATPHVYFGYEKGRAVLSTKEGRRELRLEDIDQTQSILSQRKDPDTYPVLTRLAALLGRLRLYRNWQFGPDSPLRAACRPDVRTDYLSEDLDNLPARLAALRRNPGIKRRLVELVRELAPEFDDFEVVPEGGTLSLYLSEGDRSFSARRLSDGTLRYLCLLAILLDPDPAPLIGIEEPELGFHPDIQAQLAALLVEASARTQLVVTTHSDMLVDALSDTPEAIVVCEKVDGGTQLGRLDADQLKPWLAKYRLGELWTRGDLGGTRW